MGPCRFGVCHESLPGAQVLPQPIRRRKPVIGLALGGGAARGWAHIGVIRALHEAGIEPNLISGTSIGALVGAVHAADKLDWLEQWVTGLTWRSVMRLLDLRLSGGLLGGTKVIDVFSEQIGSGTTFSDLRLPLAAVATELESGREIWLQEGAVTEAVRASIALPGLFTPVVLDGVWLVDGGLVNPVPVSVARAMRADVVIAVDLNTDLLGYRSFPATNHSDSSGGRARGHDRDADPEFEGGAGGEVGERPDWWRFLRLSGPERQGRPRHALPSMLSSLGQSLNIMQVRISRSRLAGEPADILITPRLGGMGFFDFHKAAPAIEEGRAAVLRAIPNLKTVLRSD